MLSTFVSENNWWNPLSNWNSQNNSVLAAMAPHSSSLAWRIPWTEEPVALQSMGSLGVGHTERLHFPFSLSCIGEGNGNPLQCSWLENPRDGGPWWAAVYGVTQSRTHLKWRSNSSNNYNTTTITVSSIWNYNIIHCLCRTVNFISIALTQNVSSRMLFFCCQNDAVLMCYTSKQKVLNCKMSGILSSIL